MKDANQMINVENFKSSTNQVKLAKKLSPKPKKTELPPIIAASNAAKRSIQLLSRNSS